MKRNVLKLMLALWTLAFSSPAFAFVCDMPCKLRMSQQQMQDCLRVCATDKSETSIGKKACVRLELKAQPSVTLEAAPSYQAPLFAMLDQQGIPALVSLAVRASGTPLRGPPDQLLLENSRANAPPQLI